MGVLGCDVSNHQGIVNWPLMAADGIRFAWCKATEGATMLDKLFARNIVEARKAGVVAGAYHYAYPTGGDARAEAEYFLRVIGEPRDGDLIPVLDFEETDPIVLRLGAKALNAWAVEWLGIVERALGYKPILYSYPYYLLGTLAGGTKELRRYPLWLADYGANRGSFHPMTEVGAKAARGFEVVARQFTSNGRYGGYSRLDLNDAPSLERLRVRYEPVPVEAPGPTGKRKKLGPLPGPRKKPKWFWPAVAEFVRRRRGK
jgi:GH25 family lysozyme M1 (1,4-beta-N-acetylmuramidase)